MVNIMRKMRDHFSLFFITKSNRATYNGIHVKPDVKAKKKWSKKRLSLPLKDESNNLSNAMMLVKSMLYT